MENLCSNYYEYVQTSNYASGGANLVVFTEKNVILLQHNGDNHLF